MAHDKEGNLHPLMLSELIARAQQVLREHGDMPVWAQTSMSDYDDEIVHSVPVGHVPMVQPGSTTEGYWPGKYKEVFVVSGSETG